MFKHILVPVDFGPCSLRAVDLACTLVRLSGGQITLLHVLDADQSPDGPVQRLNGLARCSRQPSACLIVPAPNGVVTGILTAAEHLHADLLVLGAHGHYDPERRALGRVTCGVLLGTRVPVQVAPQGLDPTPHHLQRWRDVGRS